MFFKKSYSMFDQRILLNTLIFGLLTVCSCLLFLVNPPSILSTSFHPPITHKVRSGETLWEIAKKYNIPMGLIIEANDIKDPSRLRINQSLKIPPPDFSKKDTNRHPELKKGVYYRLIKGDTLWELSRTYQVSINKIKEANDIDSPKKLRVGKVIFIPMTETQLKMFQSNETLKNSLRKRLKLRGVKQRDWKYIVIHHSATDIGNAASFNYYHKYKRHMTNGLAYHFVITNGNKGPDGKIEIGNRWKKQLQGGHVKSEYINETGIGVCLVGNFQKYSPTKKQIRSLSALLQVIQEMTRIPSNRITGHGDIKKEYTLCPGKYFPMKRIKKMLMF